MEEERRGNIHYPRVGEPFGRPPQSPGCGNGRRLVVASGRRGWALRAKEGRCAGEREGSPRVALYATMLLQTGWQRLRQMRRAREIGVTKRVSFENNFQKDYF